MKRYGFTLIELLIVVAIIAILAAIAVPNFLEAQTRAKVSRVQADLRSMATGIETYVIDYNRPISLVARNSSYWASKSGPINGPSVFHSGINGISSRFIALTTPVAYMTSVPRDPFIPSNSRFALSADDGTLGQPINEYDSYDFADARTVWTGGMLGGTRGSAVSSGASWHIVGAGPDKMNAFGGGTAGYTAGVRARGVDYDATNGTLSNGDIVRIGSGSAPHGTGSNRPAINRITGQYIAVP